MRAKITLEISKCNSCPYHEIHGIRTADSFENETGIYCGEQDDITDSWERYTYDGRVDKKLIHSYDIWESSEANVPAWCPFLIKEYDRIIKDIVDNHKNNISKKDEQIIDLASKIITALAIYKFDGCVYSGALHYGSIERDLRLAKIAQLAKSQFLNTEKLGLGKEDAEIVKTAAGYATEEGITNLVNVFKEVKLKAKGSICLPALDSNIVVPAAVYLAEMIVTARLYYTNVDFTFKNRGKDRNGLELPIKTAELRYTAIKYYEDGPIDYPSHILDGEEKYDIMQQYIILSKIFGIKTYKYFINGTQISIGKIKEKLKEEA